MIDFLGSPYFGFLALFIMVSFLQYDPHFRKYLNLMFCTLLSVLIIFCAVRNGSPDQVTYEMYFRKIPPLDSFSLGSLTFEMPDPWSQSTTVDLGFGILISIIKYLGLGTVEFFGLIALFNLGVTWWFCKRFSPEPALSFILYFSWFFYPTIGAIRHSVSISCLMLLVGFILDRKFFRSIATVGVGISFHKISAAMAPLYIFLRIPRADRLIFSAIPFAVLIAIASGGVFEPAVTLFGEFLPEVITSKHVEYRGLSENEGSVWGMRNSVLSGMLIKQLFIIGALFYGYTVLKERFDGFVVLLAHYSLAPICYCLFLDLKIASDRLASFFSIFEIVLLPMVIYLFKERWPLRAALLLLALIQLYSLYGVQLRPYKTIFLS